jgi:hypothetical protein
MEFGVSLPCTQNPNFSLCSEKLSLHASCVSLKGFSDINPLNAELNPICQLLALLGAHHILHVSRVRVKTRIV